MDNWLKHLDITYNDVIKSSGANNKVLLDIKNKLNKPYLFEKLRLIHLGPVGTDMPVPLSSQTKIIGI